MISELIPHSMGCMHSRYVFFCSIKLRVVCEGGVIFLLTRFSSNLTTWPQLLVHIITATHSQLLYPTIFRFSHFYLDPSLLPQQREREERERERTYYIYIYIYIYVYIPVEKINSFSKTGGSQISPWELTKEQFTKSGLFMISDIGSI